MSGGVTLKYVRHSIAGFTVWPVAGYQVHHKHVGAMLKRNADLDHGEILSAGFVSWTANGLPWCHGHSESLGISCLPAEHPNSDTDALRAEWGMTAPAPSATAHRDAAQFGAAMPDLRTQAPEGL